MKTLYRVVTYICGLLALALGIVLNTKANLGVSPIISIPYSVSVLTGQNLGAVTAGIYIIYVLGQLAVLRRRFRPVQLLQLPLSIVFGLLINLFGSLINIGSRTLPTDLLVLVLGIFFTGLGASLTMLMNILPNAADGFVQAVSQKTGKKLGAVKNAVDVGSVAVALVIGLVSGGKVIGIGLGTILAVIGVGRTIALISGLYEKRLFARIRRPALKIPPAELPEPGIEMPSQFAS